MAAHGHESLGLFPIPPLQHPGDGRLQVVIADSPRHTTEMLERPDVAIDEDLLCFVGIDPMKGPARCRQPHHEHPADHHLGP
jgi:hypothetical protein